GNEDVAGQAEQAEVAPEGRVELLVVADERLRVGGGIEAAREVGEVGDALLLVDDQALDHLHVLGFGLEPQGGRGRAVDPAVVHVDVQVAAHVAPGPQVGEAMERPSAPVTETRAGVARPEPASVTSIRNRPTGPRYARSRISTFRRSPPGKLRIQSDVFPPSFET